MLADQIWAAADVPCAPHLDRPGRRGGPRRGHRPDGRAARRGVVRRRPRRLQRRRQLRALGPRRRRPGRGVRVLRAALRPGAGDALPRRRALLDPRLRPARRHRRAPAGRDRDPAQRDRADLRLRRPRHDLGPAERRPRGDAGDRPPGGRQHLQAAHGYRGAFGIDGVLTADGFRPTELNTRMSAGATAVSEVDRRFFTLLQANLVAGVDTGLTAADVEGLVPLMDETRTGNTVAVGRGHQGRGRPTPTRSPGTAPRFRAVLAGHRQHAGGRRHPDRLLRQGRSVRGADSRGAARARQHGAAGVRGPRVRRPLRHPRGRARPAVTPVS